MVRQLLIILTRKFIFKRHGHYFGIVGASTARPSQVMNFSCGLWTLPPLEIFASEFSRIIRNAAHSGVYYFFSRNRTSGMNNASWNGQPEGYCSRQCVFEDLQRWTTSRRLTDGSDYNRNNNSSMWPDNVLTVLCYFLAAISMLKV